MDFVLKKVKDSVTLGSMQIVQLVKCKHNYTGSREFMSKRKLGIVMHICNPSSGEAGTGSLDPHSPSC